MDKVKKVNEIFNESIIYLQEGEYSDDISGIDKDKLKWLKDNNFIFIPIKHKEDNSICHWNSELFSCGYSTEYIIKTPLEELKEKYRYINP